MSMFDLKGRRGIITGASSGLGLAMANVLAEAGATVYALSRTGGVKGQRDRGGWTGLFDQQCGSHGQVPGRAVCG